MFIIFINLFSNHLPTRVLLVILKIYLPISNPKLLNISNYCKIKFCVYFMDLIF